MEDGLKGGMGRSRLTRGVFNNLPSGDITGRIQNKSEFQTRCVPVLTIGKKMLTFIFHWHLLHIRHVIFCWLCHSGSDFASPETYEALI